VNKLTLLTTLLLSAVSASTIAATVDGRISSRGAEYSSNTNGSEGSAKWGSYGRSTNERNDASGGQPFDITYLGTEVGATDFSFGAQGGRILNGQDIHVRGVSNGISLGDFAINVSGSANDPSLDSSGFDYAIRLVGLDVVGTTTEERERRRGGNRTVTTGEFGTANFELLSGGDWLAADMTAEFGSEHESATYLMENPLTTQAFTGAWSYDYSSRQYTLEGGFDLGLLGIFDGSAGVISTFITMECANDEALVNTAYFRPGKVSAVPVPAAAFLMMPALLGFIGLRRKKVA